MATPTINLTPTSDAVGQWKWRASVVIDDNLGLGETADTPLDALSILAIKLAVLLQRNRETTRREQAEADLRAQR